MPSSAFPVSLSVVEQNVYQLTIFFLHVSLVGCLFEEKAEMNATYGGSGSLPGVAWSCSQSLISSDDGLVWSLHCVIYIIGIISTPLPPGCNFFMLQKPVSFENNACALTGLSLQC